MITCYRCVTLFHDNIAAICIHGCDGQICLDKLQRTLDNVVAGSLPVQLTPTAAAGISHTPLSTSGEGTAGFTQDNGAGDVHLHGGKKRGTLGTVFCDYFETWKLDFISFECDTVSVAECSSLNCPDILYNPLSKVADEDIRGLLNCIPEKCQLKLAARCGLSYSVTQVFVGLKQCTIVNMYIKKPTMSTHSIILILTSKRGQSERHWDFWLPKPY